MESSLNKIKAILKKEIGLDASTIGQATIDKILNERMRSCKITELDDYYIHLNNNNQELHLLLETSVIPETWLFRDDKPFKIILDKISRQLVSHPEKLCSILCIPCSTGEEPYSIAIDLTDNGIPKSSFEIQAVDISHNSIAIAKQAVYGSNSFRSEKSKQHIEKYFTPVKSEYRLHDNVKSLVNFNQVNIIDRKTLPFVEKFNFILCRNLLIYFDTSTKATAYNNLHSLLSDDGILFIGHSEFGSVPDDIFVTKKIDSVYCLIKKSNDHPNNKRQINSQFSSPFKNNSNTIKGSAPQIKKAFSDPEKYTQEENQKEKSKPTDKNHTDNQDEHLNLIKQARILANSGDLSEAESLCYQYIDIHNDNEEPFFLLGLINEASGNTTQAQDFYKKSLYLNPKHYETLIHLSLIMKSQGDIETSNRLKERAERALK